LQYDSTKESLFRPGRATDFFQHGPLPSDASLCAEMARLAYVTSDKAVAAFLARANFTLLKFVDNGGSQAFAAGDGGRVVVAFRGTEASDPTDLGFDVDAELSPCPQGGQAHRGFMRALELVWPTLEPVIPANARVLMTGHSLGAAVATLAATRRPGAQLVTCGSPRVGDAQFVARAMANVPHERYVDCADIVTRVPPEELGYRHTGTRHYIDQHGKEHVSISDGDVESDRLLAEADYLKRFAFRSGSAPTRGLADHAPINYLSGVAGLRQ
jgi:triacylglycerol lipase